jgi:hypothetical protein
MGRGSSYTRHDCGSVQTHGWSWVTKAMGRVFYFLFYFLSAFHWFFFKKKKKKNLYTKVF